MKLKIKNISKTYSNGVEALKDISLTIENGMFGLLGPNGAGKSTLMRTIAALQSPDKGSIFLGDIDILNQKNELRKVLGYLPQEFGLYPKVTAIDLLDHMAVLKGITKKSERKESTESLLAQTNLWDSRHQKLGGFSGGMKQRFGIAQALIGNPKLIIVDEPTAGLDPSERNRFHNLLSEIGENIIVILSTHIVDDVSDLCNQMAIILNGDVKIIGEPLVLLESLKNKVWSGVIEKKDLEDFLKDERLISSRLYMGKFLVKMFDSGSPGNSFSLINPEIEDLYFSIINGLKLNGETT